MCGNGARAFVEYLRTEGLIELEVGETVKIGTRAGVKTVARTEEGYAIDMGPWSFIHGEAAREGGEGLPGVCSRPEDSACWPVHFDG